ncbi:hypothetical protein AVEN_89654-1 [Araneus ventricosus]|uniref:Transcriptional coactivator p15 (PC4) C-terminal domain-containing protein n=1 Tax=Araneus ventricosus TaxID=182803 RepID=A0A4Y2EUW3_ARAVE|nr:hypothetical protein AVEN_89654-1 [Araneus ventricosus]
MFFLTAPAKKPSTLINTDGFTADSIPPHYYHLGEDNHAVVSDFRDAINVHIRKFRMDENGRIFPAKNGVSFSPFMFETLSNDMPKLPLPSDSEQVIINIYNTLFLASAWNENIPHVSLQRFLTKRYF